jgi:hypothetical protein
VGVDPGPKCTLARSGGTFSLAVGAVRLATRCIFGGIFGHLEDRLLNFERESTLASRALSLMICPAGRAGLFAFSPLELLEF